MPDIRVKSIRLDMQTHQMLKTLSGYLNRPIVDLIGESTKKLWQETFPKLPLPAGDERKPRKQAR